MEAPRPANNCFIFASRLSPSLRVRPGIIYTFLCRSQEHILGAHMSGKAEIDSPTVIFCPLEAELGDWLHSPEERLPTSLRISVSGSG